MNLLQMAEKVLEEEKRALTAWGIWQAAENKGYDKLTDSKGNSHVESLVVSLHDDMRDNPSSIFATLGDRPTRFILKRQLENIRPGKQIRIIENINYVVDDLTHITEVIATKGSIGTILSYREYFTTTDETAKDSGHVIPKHHREWVYSGMETGIRYPIRFDEVVPLSDDDYATLKEEFDIVDLSCRVGAIMILPTSSFVVII